MTPEELVEVLKQWVDVTEDLATLVPAASPLDLVEYVKGVIASPVAAVVLSSALGALPAVEAPAPAAPQKRAFGTRR